MSAVAATCRSLFENPNPMPPMRIVDAPRRGTWGGTVWRDVPLQRDEPQRAATMECAEEDGERWDGMA